jgi:hypothetical protein
MESFAVLPSNADYTKVLPLAVESRSRRRTFFPVNGQSFTSDGNNIIRIDLSAQAFLDPKHSYLRFKYTNTTGAGNTMGFDFGGGHSFIERLRIEQAGNVLCDTNNYNKLMSAIILPAQGGMESVATRSITEGQRFANSAANQANVGPANEVSGAAITTPTNSDALIAAANGSFTFSIPLMNGLIGTTQDKLVPLQLLGSSPLTIEIQLAPSIDIGIFAGAADPTGYTLSDVRYIAQLVEVGPEVDANLRMVQELSGGRLVMNGVDYTHFSGNISANAGGNVSINVPARRKSLKSLFFVGSSNTFAGGAKRAAYNLSFGGNFNMNDYQLKVGSVVYPPTPVDCQFAANPEFSRSEAASELAKCFGTLGSVNGLGSLNTTNYASTNCLVASMAGTSAAGAAMQTFKFAPFGLDLEAFQRTAIESGVNTADQSLPITLTINVGAAINEAINVDAYVAYDALYFIDEVGNIRVSM